MIGSVDTTGRAIVGLAIRREAADASSPVDAWVDTGCTSDLVLPQDTIASLQLNQSGIAVAELGDGSMALMDVYSCFVDWFGEMRPLDALDGEGDLALLGVGLLKDSRVSIDYITSAVSIERP